MFENEYEREIVENVYRWEDGVDRENKYCDRPLVNCVDCMECWPDRN